MSAEYLMPVVDSAHPEAVYPADRKPGCLERKTPFGMVKGFARAAEKIKVIPSNRWEEYADVSCQPFVKTVYDQDGIGSCATEATAGAMKIARAFAGLEFVEFNPWFIYHHTSGGVDRGSSIDENLQFILEHGCAPESVWPRSMGWRAKPSAAAYEAAKAYRDFEVYDIATINEMVSALLGPCPVVYGANGHAVVKVKHLDSSKGLDLNSWGDWRDHGFGVWASYRAVNFSYGAFALRAARK